MCRHALGGGLHLLAQLGVERGRRRLLDQLLVAALDRALALAAGEHAAVRVAEHLDLDVPRRRDRLLDVERAVGEGGHRLVRRARVRARAPPRVGHGPHARPPPPAAASRSWDGELVGGGERLLHRRGALRARHERHAGRAHLRLRLRLVAHPRHHVRGRPDEDEIVVLARAHEVGVLGEEAVARMHRLAAGRRRGRDDRGDAEVALRGGRRADAHRAVGETHVQRVLVGGRVDRDRFDPELVQRMTRGDLAAIRNEDLRNISGPSSSVDVRLARKRKQAIQGRRELR